LKASHTCFYLEGYLVDKKSDMSERAERAERTAPEY
jgi:hypothetical protein